MADPLTPDDVEGILRFDSAYIGDSVRAALDLLSQVDDHHVIALRDGRLVVVGLEEVGFIAEHRHDPPRPNTGEWYFHYEDEDPDRFQAVEAVYRLRPAEGEHSEEGRDG